MQEALDREALHRLIVSTKPVDGYTSELLNREYYETHHRIFDHNDAVLAKSKPFALVAKHKAEDSYSYSLLRRYLFRFRHHGINKNWGLSLAEFLELPWNVGNDLFTIEQIIAKQAQEEAKQMGRTQELEARQAEINARRGKP